MSGSFACMHVCIPHVPTEARKGHWVPWNLKSRQLWASKWILGIAFRSSGRTANTLNHSPISAATNPLFLLKNRPGAFCPLLGLHQFDRTVEKGVGTQTYLLIWWRAHGMRIRRRGKCEIIQKWLHPAAKTLGTSAVSGRERWQTQEGRT